MTYRVKEIFPTLQGEGIRAGTRAVFLRLAGCNLWNGRPEDRSKGRGACAAWCDTDFVGGEALTADQIVERLRHSCELAGPQDSWVVITGGEPLLQLDARLLDALHMAGWMVAVETNGTIAAPVGIDWLTVSPKVGSELVQRRGDELKVVLSVLSGTWLDDSLEGMRRTGNFANCLVQPQDPIDGDHVQVSHLHGGLDPFTKSEYAQNVKRCVDFVMRHPPWRLSLQQHKLIGLP